MIAIDFNTQVSFALCEGVGSGILDGRGRELESETLKRRSRSRTFPTPQPW